MLDVGVKGFKTVKVEESNTAINMGSGDLPVFSTPAMIALMEATSSASIKHLLCEGNSSVGTFVSVHHLSATPIDMTVRCESELVKIDRKRLVFKVFAFDECGLIGEGTHERFIITKEKFLNKTYEKRGRE